MVKFMKSLNDGICIVSNSSCQTSVPEITCPMPLSEDGIITVSRSYVQTGGLPLTALMKLVTYMAFCVLFTYTYKILMNHRQF